MQTFPKWGALYCSCNTLDSWQPYPYDLFEQIYVTLPSEKTAKGPGAVLMTQFEKALWIANTSTLKKDFICLLWTLKSFRRPN